MPFLPADNINNTAIIYLHQTRTRSQLIYSLTLIAVFAALASLPFIYTTVSVKGTGSVQSNIERTELLAPANGRLLALNLIDNQKVKRGETLLIIDAALPRQQSGLLNNHTQQLQQQLHDAQILLQAINSPTASPRLQTGLYLASWQQYTGLLENATNAKEQALSVFNRYQTLFKNKVVTQAEYEQYRFNYNQALSDWQMVTRKYKTQWQTEATQYRDALRDVQNQQVQLNEQEKQYVLKSPVTGSIQNLSGLHTGAFVFANQKLGEISPDSSLMAYCYIKPGDIGLIKIGQTVRVRVDAFNYNQWGILNAKVVDISDDIIILNQAAFFKVKCRLDKNYLQLKNGYRGQVKKGMSFSASFTITKRSLYQLIYDKADDWLNPEKGE